MSRLHKPIGNPAAAARRPWPEIDCLRLGVVVSNTAALAFWRKLGYRETGEVKPPQPGIVAELQVFEKPLRRSPTR